MHSIIFVIDTDVKEENIKDYIYDGVDLNQIIESYKPEAADYVDDGDIEEDIELFESWYKVKAEKIKTKGGAIYKVNERDFLESIKKHSKESVNEIKRLINEPKPDLWKISELANPKDEDFFIVNTSGLFNEFDVNLYLEGLQYFYIVKSFDYHF